MKRLRVVALSFALLVSLPLFAAVFTVTSAAIDPPVPIPPPLGGGALSSATYSVSERDGFVRITVNRIGGESGERNVSYSTAPGTATAGVDYTPVSGTLTWADHDTEPKTFDVPIANDVVEEGAETFTVTIAGDVLGAGPLSAVVTIQDDDAPPIPTASEWALMLTAAMLAIAGALVLKR